MCDICAQSDRDHWSSPKHVTILARAGRSYPWEVMSVCAKHLKTDRWGETDLGNYEFKVFDNREAAELELLKRSL